VKRKLTDSLQTVWSLTQLLDAEATTTAQVGRKHVRKVPERTGDVNPLYALVAPQGAICTALKRFVYGCCGDTPLCTPTFWRMK
jgi:hypothetical protein